MNDRSPANGNQAGQAKSAMRVAKITVKGLFGVFNHEIPLNSAGRVTIIHGPNGFGKTVILRMLAALAKGKCAIFQHTPFTEFCVTLNDGAEKIVQREIQESPEGGSSVVKLKFVSRSASGDIEEYAPSMPANPPRQLLAQVDRHVPSPYRLLEDGWVDDQGHQYTLLEILDLFPEATLMLPQEFRSIQNLPPGFLDLQVFFIETNRLGPDPASIDSSVDEESAYRRAFTSRERQPRPMLSRVKAFSKDLVQRIRSVLTDYAKNSQESDRTFPERLVRFVSDRESALAEREILDELTELEKKRQRLIHLGLLDSESGLKDLAEEDIRRAPEALTIYVRDVQQKLKVFDELAGRIGGLIDIVNSRFNYKHLKIDRERGFEAISDQHETIQLEDLSSGEQHELVVLYELLFRVPKDALVLVDEPEISLHVAWQSQFLSDLIGILQATDAYAIVATHSPTIIGSRWDLTKELKGPDPGTRVVG